MKLFPCFKCLFSPYEEKKDDCSHIPDLLHNPSLMVITHKTLPTLQPPAFHSAAVRDAAQRAAEARSSVSAVCLARHTAASPTYFSYVLIPD